jgi:tRNA pseudouridine38-40 synthase
MQRYKLTIAYDGSGFHGWQEQVAVQGPALRTVQGVMRQTLQRVLGQPIELTGASRTDTGVHARGQVAHFDADTPIPLSRLAKAINARLPDDVEVRQVEPVDRSFHAIRGAVDKQYRYRIWASQQRPLGLRHMVYHWWGPLELKPMQDAAARLIGEHDFAAFANAGHGRTSTVRRIFDCRVVTAQPPQVDLVVRGNGFLYNMVRIITGTLIEIGRGHWPPDRVDALLESGDRQQAGPTVPPNGLCLEWIEYQST